MIVQDFATLLQARRVSWVFLIGVKLSRNTPTSVHLMTGLWAILLASFPFATSTSYWVTGVWKTKKVGIHPDVEG